jgi:hypothetical protein
MLDPRRLHDGVVDVDGELTDARDFRDSPEGETVVRRSFFVDAGMVMVNAVMRTPPSVYYAENNILYGFDTKEWIQNRASPVIYAGLMLAVAAATVFLRLPIERIEVLSGLMVAPILFVVGVKVIAHALMADRREAHASHAAAAPDGGVLDFMPTAVIIILTPIEGLGLEWSLPLGITMDLVRSVILKRKLELPQLCIGIGGAVVLALMAAPTLLSKAS